MSEVQEVYLTAADRRDFDRLQRCADLSELADYRGGAVRLWLDEKGQNVAIDERGGVTRYFFGERAIAEAAAFVRGGG